MIYYISSFIDDLYNKKMFEYTALNEKYTLTPEQYIFPKEHRQSGHMRQNLTATEIFQLRQSIELRILEILGVRGINESNGAWKKITADQLANALDIEKGYIFPICITNIMKIHHWTNVFIHQGFIGNYWLS
ncbi:hypothetical protein SAMN05660742_107112 [Propionispira arboris]|uniref:Uncharacterized protein n=1 Tax=Propionispira arboris TaxID=84035 RepID=A0A1H6Z0C9_9FIRM|nr:hypothetical protein [Propionispira arboris]SEJ42990.1 hypothetical protein SAMN05660742_107112 [Propionispira arboris]